jgi:hypothetical protein
MANTPSTRANALSFHSTAFGIVDHQGQPWLKANEIAQALGYADESAINRIYARRSDEFTDAMTWSVKLTDLLAMFARTSVAKEFRVWVLDVLERQTANNIQPAYDADQIALAHRAAVTATAEVYQSVFDAVMQGQDWQLNRYMLRFDATAEDGAVARVKPVDRNAYVMPIERFHSAIEDSMMVDAQTLTQLASTCTTRLGRMAARNAVAAPQHHSKAACSSGSQHAGL